MKSIKVLTVALLAFVSAPLWAQQAATPVLAPAVPAIMPPAPNVCCVDLYKVEAVKLLVTPVMRDEAAALTKNPMLREKVELAMAIDPLYYDGLRLVRSRGVITGDFTLDDLTVYKAVKSFNVTPQEAKAWLVASRLMQLGDFKNDGIALTSVEESVLHTSAEHFCELRGVFGFDGACRIMPRMAVTLGYAFDRHHDWRYRHHRTLFGLSEDGRGAPEYAYRDQARWNWDYAMDGAVWSDDHGPAVHHADY